VRNSTVTERGHPSLIGPTSYDTSHYRRSADFIVEKMPSDITCFVNCANHFASKMNMMKLGQPNYVAVPKTG
jgi:hypothetical protein